jgi:hypothetical protein
MKHFLLSCLTLVTLTACHVDNGYYYDTPSYDSSNYHGHDSYPEHRHERGRRYIPNNRHHHGHNEEVIINESSPRDARTPSNRHGHDDNKVIIGIPSTQGPQNQHGHR